MTSCPYPSAWQRLESELGGPGAAGSWPCPPTWVCLWPGPSASQCGAWPVAGVSGGRRPLARAAAAMSRKEEGQKLGAPNWAHGEDGAWLTLSRCSCPGPRWVGPRLLRKLRHLSGKETSSPLRRRSFSDQSRPSLNLRALHASPVPHPTPTHFGFNLGSESLGMLVVPPGPFPKPLPGALQSQRTGGWTGGGNPGARHCLSRGPQAQGSPGSAHLAEREGGIVRLAGNPPWPALWFSNHLLSITGCLTVWESKPRGRNGLRYNRNFFGPNGTKKTASESKEVPFFVL